MLYAKSNEISKVFENLEKAFTLNFFNYKWIENEEMFDKVRNKKKFKAIIEKMKEKSI